MSANSHPVMTEVGRDQSAPAQVVGDVPSVHAGVRGHAAATQLPQYHAHGPLGGGEINHILGRGRWGKTSRG